MVSKWKNTTWALLITPSFVISLLMLLTIILLVLLAPLIAPYNPNKLDLSQSFLSPSFKHLLGTDREGRDFFSRLLYGGRTTILSALGVTGMAFAIGVPLGLICGYFGGLFDTIVMRFCDINLAFPTLLLAFVFIACFGRNISNTIIALGIIYLPIVTRFTRSLAMVEKNKTYVEAGKSIGYNNFHLLFSEILPNCVQSIIVQITLMLAGSILDLAGLSFLGLGVQPPTADWGNMLEEGQDILLSNPLIAILPGIAIIITIVSINILSDCLQMYWDPFQRKIPKRFFKKNHVKIHVKTAAVFGKFFHASRAEVQ